MEDNSFDFAGKNYNEMVNVAWPVVEQLLQKGAGASAVHGAMDFMCEGAAAHLVGATVEDFRSSVARRGTKEAIVDPAVSPEAAITVLGEQKNDLHHALSLADFGKDLNRYNEKPERAVPVFALARQAYADVWAGMQAEPLESRTNFYVDEYVRLVHLHDEAGLVGEAAQVASRIAEDGAQLFAEVQRSDIDDSGFFRGELRRLASYIEGGTNNPLAQRILRLTSPEAHIMDATEFQELQSVGNSLLKCGMIDAAFAAYEIARRNSSDARMRASLQRNGNTPEEIEEHIRKVNGAFPGYPWEALDELQELPDTAQYVNSVLDRIIAEYPTTFERFSFVDVMGGDSAYRVLVRSERTQELITIIRNNYKEDRSGNLYVMASRMAYVMGQCGKDLLYEAVLEAAQDVPGAIEALQAGYAEAVAQR